jgi:hypothetical protein
MTAIQTTNSPARIEGDSADFMTRLVLAEFTVGNTEEFKKTLILH